MKANPSPSFPRWLMAAPACAVLAVSTLFAQQPAQPATSSSNDEVVKMSPFQVQASNKDIGYYAENTLAGSRLNTNVGDLASSITVVTKQQLIDTASVDINDVFMYEANTEGAHTYTPSPFIAASNRLADALAGWNDDNGKSGYGMATANRVRGLDVSDIAVNNYPASARIMFDSYNTNSIEINRGPNSLLFGIGSPAGITNQSTTSAVLNQRKTEVSYELSSWGGYRATVSHNQPLGDKLAIYVAALYDSKGFERKPSYDVYRRQYGTITYQPFSKTRITLSFENFDNRNRRPNFITPQDAVTPWLQAGRPSWNPVTQMVTYLDSGRTVGPFITDTRDARYASTIAAYPGVSSIAIGNSWLTAVTSPMYVPALAVRGHSYALFNQGNLLSMWQGTPAANAAVYSGSTITVFPTGIKRTQDRTQADWILAANRPTQSTFAPAPLIPNGTVLADGTRVPNGTALYTTWYAPGVTNKAIYDWDSVNLNAMNYGSLGAKTYNVELQQEIMNSDKWGSLNFDAGWFRQEIAETDNYAVGQANQKFSVYVDTNQVMADGSANPFLGSPMIFDYTADTFQRPEINNNFRAMLAYEKDLTKNSNWTRWLGRHRVMALWSRQEDILQNLRYRLAIDGGDTRYLPNSNVAGWSYLGSNVSGGAFDRWYYVGQNQSGTVQYSPDFVNVPGSGGIGSAQINTYNFANYSEDHPTVNFETIYTPAGTTPVAQKIIESQNLAWQGYFWKNRIVATFGWRRDDFRSRQTDFSSVAATSQFTNGFFRQDLLNMMNNWSYLSGRTKTAGVVARPLVWSWGSLGGHLNRSDNFNAPASIQYDYFGNRLGKPQGKGKDYGIDLTLFDNKLVARINWFESDNQNAPSTQASTAAGRITRIDTTSMRGWAEWVVRYRNGEDINSYFGNNTVHPYTAYPNFLSDVTTLMQDPTYIASINGWPTGWRASTQQNKAKGIEAQLIYNPMRNWNIKVTVGKQRSTYDNVAPELFAWLNTRLATWQHATATGVPTGQFLVTTGAAGTGTRETKLDSFWTGYGFSDDAKLSNTSGNNPTWTTPEGFYQSTATSDINVMLGLQGQTVPNERIWSANAISTYAFTKGWLNGVSVGGGIRWADRAIAGYYGDTTNLNSSGQIAALDLSRPIYTPSETHYDLWASYTTKVPKIFGNKVKVRFQLNVRDLTEGGGLQAIAYNMDGSPAYFRIKDPRQFLFTTTFDF
jgi:hypothetical protein